MTDGDDKRLPKGLKLQARDTEDLNILSAALQDALIPVADFAYLPDDRTFVGVFNRFMWEVEPVALSSWEPLGDDEPDRIAGQAAPPAPYHFRTHSALVFRDVDRVQAKGMTATPQPPFLCLLAIRSDAAAHEVQLDFAGHATIRLTVSTIHAVLEDKGIPWATRNQPSHPFAETAATP